jgi:hypothetical protein
MESRTATSNKFASVALADDLDTHVLRHGSRDAARAHRRRKCDRGPSQSRILLEPRACWRNVGKSVFSSPAGDLGVLQIAYDMGLLFSFRNVKPPEEKAREAVPAK